MLSCYYLATLKYTPTHTPLSNEYTPHPFTDHPHENHTPNKHKQWDYNNTLIIHDGKNKYDI